MSDTTFVVMALATGMILGALFFGGLWWTVSRALTAANPALWFGLSAVLRMAILVSGLYYVARGGWPSLLACLCGLLIARVSVTGLTHNAC
ncbi:MAG TPA: ATP synthase subunit I [Steroidobacteraceae bacterium]